MENKKSLERKIKRTMEMLKALEERKEHLSKHGYWDMGYLQGKLSVLQDWLDEMAEEE